MGVSIPYDCLRRTYSPYVLPGNSLSSSIPLVPRVPALGSAVMCRLCLEFGDHAGPHCWSLWLLPKPLVLGSNTHATLSPAL